MFIFPKGLFMAIGTIKWFNTVKGYGFIQPDVAGEDVFVHIASLTKSGITSVKQGEKVSYEVVTFKGKTSAANLKLVD